MKRTAMFSDCGLYRYELGRQWSEAPGVATFIMLNPSTATEYVDDPTIRRCIGYAQAWGMGRLHVLNIYAYRSTDPAGLWTVNDPVGPDNDHHIAAHAQLATETGWPLVAAWGVNARPERIKRVLTLTAGAPLSALAVAKAGQPRHPLYLRRDAALAPWPTPQEGTA